MLRSLAISAVLLSSAAYAEDFTVVAPVSAVTVYPQGATVTRVISADLPQGRHRILLPYTPTHNTPPRLQAPEGVVIGAMEVLNNYLTDPKAAYTPEQAAAAERVDAAQEALQALEDVVVRGQAVVEAQGAKNAYLRTLTGAALTGADADAMRAASNMVAEELEKEMDNVITTYQCEWKTTVDNPDKVKRFRQFVNSDQTDNNLGYVLERGQRRPATKEEKQKQLIEAINV